MPKPQVHVIITGSEKSGKTALAHALSGQSEYKELKSPFRFLSEDYAEGVDLQIIDIPSDEALKQETWAALNPIDSSIISQPEATSAIDMALFVYDATQSLDEQLSILESEEKKLQRDNLQKFLIITKSPISETEVASPELAESLKTALERLSISQSFFIELTISNNHILEMTGVARLHQQIMAIAIDKKKAAEELAFLENAKKELATEEESKRRESNVDVSQEENQSIDSSQEEEVPSISVLDAKVFYGATDNTLQYASIVKSVQPSESASLPPLKESNKSAFASMANEPLSVKNARKNFDEAYPKLIAKIDSDELDYDKKQEYKQAAETLRRKINDKSATLTDVNQFESKTKELRNNWDWRVVLGAVIGAAIGLIVGAMIGSGLGPGAAWAAMAGAYKGACWGASIGAGVGYLVGGGFGIWNAQRKDPVREVVADARVLAAPSA